VHNKVVADPVGNWKTIDIPMMRRVRGTTFGIVGCGRIGTAAGLRAKAFGMNVVFYDPYVPDGKDQSVGFERRESLEEMLREADVVSVHTPLTTETNGMINGQAISCMKESAILITTARGKVCDLDAVTDALKNNRIAAAGLDVLPDEPPNPDHPLFTALKAKAARQFVAGLATCCQVSSNAASGEVGFQKSANVTMDALPPATKEYAITGFLSAEIPSKPRSWRS
jgi:lactate dehydrogenase-like 2-hydroxyacid dehydrogenase